MATEPTPAGLAATGRRYWQRVTEVYVLTATELILLEQICRTYDEEARLERAARALAARELFVDGSLGQLKMHPVFDPAAAAQCSASSSSSSSCRMSPRSSPSWCRRGGLMAEFRGRPADLVDPRLRTFNRADWAQPGDNRFKPFWRWVAARRAWVAKHPNSQALGNQLERFRAEIPQLHPELYPADATEWG